ncbi:hypothetical protein Y1Q_0003281 [Alligator mississippiensis]|uniref:Uncharacterized protein n=1 Tax=Alligator mississippiensis TaxID=8496 RepID=A0A151MEI1_ALLMI|nr:hypothetical protein Y1Q_0003281 [Alligator mississippiensis]
MAHHCFTPRQLCGIHGPVPDEMENAPCADLIVCAPSSSSLKAYRIPQRETAVLLLLNSLEQLSHQLFSCWMSSSTSWENGGVDDLVFISKPPQTEMFPTRLWSGAHHTTQSMNRTSGIPQLAGGSDCQGVKEEPA